ncbi:MAG: choice-of-anchor B family protein [Bacteroidota bacterium]
MKRTLALTILLSFVFQIHAQLNAVLRDQLDYASSLNDIWGYVAPDGTEYAIVGLVDGVSIVSLADPDNIVEVASIPGQFSTWRDMKTFGEYAYVVADQGNSTEGLTIIDMTDIENGNVTFTNNQYDIPGAGTFERAHNIFIDVNKGRALIAGSNASNGVLFFDIATTPGEAIYLTTVGFNYSHDTYLNNGILYNSDVFNGVLSLWEVNDIFNPVQLSATTTPSAFTHNAWSTADNSVVFTTDERANAPVAAYDISDPTDPVLLDEYRPLYSLNTGTVPHNTHVLDQYLITSYYTDGVTIVDASEPDNMIEIANWDTWTGGPGGFNGCWGAYPYLPSGLVLASDISSGLFVVELEYRRAARLAGTITDAETGLPINGVDVAIQASQENEGMTNASGMYRTGLANGGNYQLTFSHPDYNSLSLSVDLINGETTILDTTLQTNQIRHAVTATVLETEVMTGIEGAELLFVNAQDDISLISDVNGFASFGFVPDGTYNVYVGKWGYRTILEENLTINGPANLNFELEIGYQDGFQLDFGWTATSSEGTTTGFWVRDVPNGTADDTDEYAPFFDADGDLGDQAYITGNSDENGSLGFDDIDNGTVTLTSPIFDLTIYEEESVRLSYQHWFVNFLGNGAPDDNFVVTISNGTDEALLTQNTDGTPGQGWIAEEFTLSQFLTLTDQMQLTVVTSDEGAGNVSEGGFDDFLIEGELLNTSTENIVRAGLEAEVFPNPSIGSFNLQYELPASSHNLQLELTDVAGRVVLTQQLESTATGNINLGATLSPGTYFLRMLDGGQMIYSTKVIKQ